MLFRIKSSRVSVSEGRDVGEKDEVRSVSSLITSLSVPRDRPTHIRIRIQRRTSHGPVDTVVTESSTLEESKFIKMLMREREKRILPRDRRKVLLP